jgi:hypothetical protein
MPLLRRVRELIRAIPANLISISIDETTLSVQWKHNSRVVLCSDGSSSLEVRQRWEGITGAGAINVFVKQFSIMVDSYQCKMSSGVTSYDPSPGVFEFSDSCWMKGCISQLGSDEDQDRARVEAKACWYRPVLWLDDLRCLHDNNKGSVEEIVFDDNTVY